MKKSFVKTSNYERFQEGLSALEGRGAAEASLLLVTGEAGFGKSETVDRWAVQTGAAYLRAKVEWTPHYFMIDLAEALKIDGRGRSKDVFGRIAGVLGAQQIPLVVDEIEHCLRDGAKVLEAIRDLSDLTEVTVVMVGMEQVQARIARYPQIASRIAHVVNFGPATLDDVKLACAQLAEISIAHDLAEEIHKQAKGRMREVMNAIALVERDTVRNGAKAVALADMVGRPLTLDWQSRRPRVIRSAGVR